MSLTSFSRSSVRVITVISGEVSTNILKNDAHRRLPEGSYYTPLAESFKQHVTRTPRWYPLITWFNPEKMSG